MLSPMQFKDIISAFRLIFQIRKARQRPGDASAKLQRIKFVAAQLLRCARNVMSVGIFCY
ncbi:hypothetical protein B2M20_04810 [Nitrobacter vulgaris]|uniref:Uncharacterized protein n=1 Tax=Nitrobacter vulgaris TaxID=29421 RepID=A0A1V4I118_NITVU|nr:hypothetical protein B2M20_04810 [Nitrobacter vulgaris]